MNMALATIRAVMREFGARDTCGAADVAGRAKPGFGLTLHLAAGSRHRLPEEKRGLRMAAAANIPSTRDADRGGRDTVVDWVLAAQPGDPVNIPPRAMAGFAYPTVGPRRMFGPRHY